MAGMATTRDYLGYLNEKIEIAPANSQEELLAAESIQQIMEEHELDVRLQEFDTSAGGRLPYRILMILLFLGVFLSGLQGTPASIAGVIVVAVCAILFLLSFFGLDVLANLGPRARSQNVIGVHRAEGPLVRRGNRPIVIVAHYDTPRESFLYSTPLARCQNFIKRMAPIFIAIACLFGLLQVLGFLPGAVRRIVWVIGIVSTLPVLVLGIEGIYTQFSTCTDGANDNKAAVAAMLGVLAKVRPQADSADGYAQGISQGLEDGIEAREDIDATEGIATPLGEDDGDAYDDSFAEEDAYGDEYDYDEEEDFEEQGAYDSYEDDQDDSYGEEPSAPAGRGAGSTPYATGEAQQAAADELPAFLRPKGASEAVTATPAAERIPQVITERYEKVEGVRHGRDVLTDLRMLPNSCEIVYVEPQLVSRSMRPQVEEAAASDAHDSTFDVIGSEEYVTDADYFDSYAPDDEDEVSGGRLSAITDSVKGFFGRVKERFGQVRDKISHRGEDEYEESEIEHTGVYEPLVLDDAEVLDLGSEDDEPVSRMAARVPEIRSSREHRARRSRRSTMPEPEIEPMPEPTMDAWAPETVEYDSQDYANDDLDSTGVVEMARDARQIETEASRVDATAAVPAAQAYPAYEDFGPAEVADTAEYPTTEPEATASQEPVAEAEPADAASAPHDAATSADLMPNLTFENEPEPTEEEMAQRDVAGLDVQVPLEHEDSDPRVIEEKPRPANVEDPSWGKSDYQPRNRSSIGRRAALYDLPDPNAASSDPFDREEPAPAPAPRPRRRSIPSMETTDVPQAPASADLRATYPDAQAPNPDIPSIRRRRESSDSQSMSDWLGVSADFDAKRHGSEVGSWDNFDDGGAGGRSWKGGATTRAGLREDGMDAEDLAEGAPESYGPEELRDAILSMGDDELIAHDIWFVALGASSLEHAGIKSFLAENRAEIRGAFLVNLDCVGAGELTTYSREGLFASRRTDRKVERLLTTVAEDLHIPLARTTHDHGDTDATSAMRSSIRAITITGLSESQVPALSHTVDDVMEEVDPSQVTAVADLVSELIRRA